MLKPFFEAHSIEAITLTCEFDGEVDAHGLTAVKDEASRLKLKYSTRRVARKSVSAAPDNHSSPPEVRGYLFLNKDGEKEKNRFEVINDNAIYTSRSYTNFKSFFADAAFSLKIGYSAFERSGKKLEKVILAYKDQFISNNIEDVLAGVKKDSPYIASACLVKNNFWHSNIGFFDADLLKENETFLNNVKVHHSLITDGNEEDTDDIEVTHALNVETYHVLGVDDFSAENFNENLEIAAFKLRARHKEIITSIISDELATLVNLNKKVVEG